MAMLMPGLIIHEGQLTYQSSGLHRVVDLGLVDQNDRAWPLPLGGNCIRKDLGAVVCQEVTDIIKQSIQYSLDHRAEAVEYALQFGRDLDQPGRPVRRHVRQRLDVGLWLARERSDQAVAG